MDIVTKLLLVLAVILVSMILHEFMHGVTAYWLGDDTAKVNGRLTFNPLRHLDPFLSFILPLILAVSGGPIFGGAKPVPIDPHKLRWGEWGMALTAIAGPATNFVLAFICFALWATLRPIGLTEDFLLLGFQVNMGFCIFNLIPIPPLDGSRVLYAVAPDGVRQIMASMERFGLIVVFVLIFFLGGLFGQIMSAGISGMFDVYVSLFRII
ncbi:MAG: site-2 protease family protein [Candidatus Nomurabacteria bacterium]|jgi:Zn-dependent protease|nr:site-2 protease family protein [Candidatus Nomurabacteria bacterium]